MFDTEHVYLLTVHVSWNIMPNWENMWVTFLLWFLTIRWNKNTKQPYRLVFTGQKTETVHWIIECFFTPQTVFSLRRCWREILWHRPRIGEHYTFIKYSSVLCVWGPVSNIVCRYCYYSHSHLLMCLQMLIIQVWCCQEARLVGALIRAIVNTSMADSAQRLHSECQMSLHTLRVLLIVNNGK